MTVTKASYNSAVSTNLFLYDLTFLKITLDANVIVILLYKLYGFLNNLRDQNF